MADLGTGFDALFRAAAFRVRLRLGVSRWLTGLAAGLVVAALLSFAALALGHPELRLLGLVAVGVGGGAALVVSRRRRMHDEDIALVLDGRLAAREAVTSALSASSAQRHPKDGRGVDRVVLSRGARLLAEAPIRATRVPALRPIHGLAPLGAIAFVTVIRLPVPAIPMPAPAPGIGPARASEVGGLPRFAGLRDLEARDPAQRKRLDALAAEAERIQKRIREGASEREVKADIAKLAEDATSERMSLGQGEERSGLESALAALDKNGASAPARKALGDQDWSALDEDMLSAANRQEEVDRDRARKSLEDAAEAAKKSGAPGVAKALDDEKKRFERERARSELLRDLARSLGDRTDARSREALADLDRKSDPEARKNLAEALANTLEGLTPTERKALANRLRELEKRAADATPNESTRPEQPGGDPSKELEAELRAMAKEKTAPSPEAAREKALGDAARGLEPGGSQGLDGSVAGGVTSMPSGPGAGASPGADGDRARSAKSAASPTSRIDGASLQARAQPALGHAAPLPGTVTGRGSAPLGETANVQGLGALRDAAATEVGGVDRNEVPEEYREQVGRYFQP